MAGDDLYYPGVQVLEAPFNPVPNNLDQVSSIAAFVGRSNKGPQVPTLVQSWSDFATRYGTNYTDLHTAVYDYFGNGGRFALINRVTGAGATTADVDVFADDAPEDPDNPGSVLPGTTPLFTIEALNPGSWANLLHVVLTARDSTNKRFDLTLFSVPSTVVFDPTKRNSEYLLDSWADLTLDPGDSRYAYDVVNAPSATGSTAIRIFGQSYDPGSPGTRPYPDVVGGYNLTGGTDGTFSAPDFDSDASYSAAINALGDQPDSFVLNVPNISDADVIRTAVQFAANRGDVFVVIDPPQGQSPSEVQSYVETDLGLGTLGVSVPSYGAVYYPWVYLPAVGSSGPGKSVLRAPGGAIAGLMMATDQTYGAWKAPAGIDARLAGATRLERALTDADLTRLNNSHVNAIRSLPGAGIVSWGARTLKKSGLDRYVNVRRSMIYIRQQLKNLTAYAVFQSNDQRLWTDLQAVCSKFLADYWQQGGLKGATAAEAYFVTCDATNNSPASVASGYVNITVGVALTTPAEFIVITIGQFDGGTTVQTTL